MTPMLRSKLLLVSFIIKTVNRFGHSAKFHLKLFCNFVVFHQPPLHKDWIHFCLQQSTIPTTHPSLELLPFHILDILSHCHILQAYYTHYR